jgi:hypothetical protein
MRSITAVGRICVTSWQTRRVRPNLSLRASISSRKPMRRKRPPPSRSRPAGNRPGRCHRFESKIQITNFTLNGITMVHSSGHIALNTDDAGHTTEGVSAVITIGGTTPITVTNSTDTLSAGATVTDPTPSGGPTSYDVLYADSSTNIVSAGATNTDSNVLSDFGTGGTLLGGTGVNVFVYNPADTAITGNPANPSTEFNILRIDLGAEYQTAQEFLPGGTTLSTNGATSNLVDLTSVNTAMHPAVTDINEILLTTPSLFGPSGNTQPTLGTELELNGTSVLSMSSAATDPLTGQTHDLFVVGNVASVFGGSPVTGGDNVLLSDFGSWTNTHIQVMSANGNTFTEFTQTVSGTTVHLFIDNVIGNVHGPWAPKCAPGGARSKRSTRWPIV